MKGLSAIRTRLQDSTSHILARLRKNRNLRPHLPLAVLIALLSIAFIVKYWTVAQHMDMGHDIANYLSTMNTLFGQDIAGIGLNRPPLIGVVLKPFTLIFGDLTGVKVLGVLLSVALGIPLYLLAKRLCHPWIAVVAALLFVFTPDYSDMLTWGYLTMFGIFFVMLTLYFLLLLLEKPSKTTIFLTGLSASLIVGFHQLSLAFFVPLFFLVIVALLLFNQPKLLASYKPLAVAISLGVLLAIPYMPLYLRMIRMQATAVSHAPVSLSPLAQVKTELSLGTDLPLLQWLLVLIPISALALVALRWTWQKDKTSALVVAVLLIYSLALILFVLPSPFAELNRRAHYFMFPAIWLLAGVVLSHLWYWQKAHHTTATKWLPKVSAIMIIVVLLVSTILLSQRTLRRAMDFYGYLDNTLWETVSWFRDCTPSESSVIVYPENLGWWIEAEGKRDTVNVTDRDTVPLAYLQEHSLAAERILSRNQGIENGNLRLATTYPYDGAPGNPVMSVYVGGSYHDTMMFDDNSTFLTMEAGETANLATESQREFSIHGDCNSMKITTSYQIGSAAVVQSARLDKGNQSAVVSYSIRSDGASTARLDIPLFFGFEPASLSIDQDQHYIEIVQEPEVSSGQVVTRISIETTGALLGSAAYESNHVDLSFNIQGNEANIIFNFLVEEPDLEGVADVTCYQASEIIKEYSIDYLVIDLKPNPNLAGVLPWGTEQWLDSCPYYKRINPGFPAGDVRIYQVDSLKLP